MFNILSANKKINIKKIKIRNDKDIPVGDVQRLFLAVGWQYRDADRIQESLQKSILVTSAWFNEKLVGIARATGDGVFNVSLWDVAVEPSFQKQGIGKLLVGSMVNKLDSDNIQSITLYSEFDKKDFYSKLGFEYNAKKIISMYRYKNN